MTENQNVLKLLNSLKVFFTYFWTYVQARKITFLSTDDNLLILIATEYDFLFTFTPVVVFRTVFRGKSANVNASHEVYSFGLMNLI